MARQEKLTRIKGLPPKILLQQKDDRSGSLPTISRTASDNRTGKFNTSFDDTTTIVFTSQSTEVSFGAGVTTQKLTSPEYQEFGQDISSSLVGTGSLVKGISDEFITYNFGQDIEPFNDFGNPAIDQISKKPGSGSNETFYSTGSAVEDVGLGFSTPLWSKSKIEIDMTPGEDHSFGIQSNLGTNSNHPMAYWNPTAKRFQPIGPGYEWTRYDYSGGDEGRDLVKQLFEEQTVGFASSLSPSSSSGIGIAKLGSVGSVISNYQFPYHAKYHATSSNLVSLSDYINEPFLAEKIVLEWSGSCAFNEYIFYASDIAASSFFIMNQREPSNFKNTQRIWHNSGAVGTQLRTVITTSVPSQNTETHRDLVTWANMVCWSESPQTVDNGIDPVVETRKELNLGPSSGNLDALGNTALTFPISSGPGSNPNKFLAGWSGRFVMSGVVKSPIGLPKDDITPGGSVTLGGGYKDVTWFHRSGTSAGDRMAYVERILESGRTGLGTPSGRDFLSPFESPQVAYSDVSLTFKNVVLVKNDKANPYLLLPTDKLILGWQVPMATALNAVSSSGDHIYPGLGPQMTFVGGAKAKLIIYGSKVKQGVESHDTLNQLLTSNTIHEVIE